MSPNAILPAVDDEDIREAMRLMGSRGGKRRAKSLTAEQRSEIASKGGKARWANRGEKKGKKKADVKPRRKRKAKGKGK